MIFFSIGNSHKNGKMDRFQKWLQNNVSMVHGEHLVWWYSCFVYRFRHICFFLVGGFSGNYMTRVWFTEAIKLCRSLLAATPHCPILKPGRTTKTSMTLPVSTVHSKLNIYMYLSSLTLFVVIVNFPLDEDPSVSVIAWTTTPWTLPSNLALCVHPDFTYIKVKGKLLECCWWRIILVANLFQTILLARCI